MFAENILKRHLQNGDGIILLLGARSNPNLTEIPKNSVFMIFGFLESMGALISQFEYTIRICRKEETTKRRNGEKKKRRNEEMKK